MTKTIRFSQQANPNNLYSFIWLLLASVKLEHFLKTLPGQPVAQNADWLVTKITNI